MDTTMEQLAKVTDLDRAWAEPHGGTQLRAIRRGAEEIRERFVDGPRAISVRTLNVATLPYPSRFAFWGAALMPFPYVTLTHRCALVQFFQQGEPKTLLFNPTDPDGAKATPYLARLVEQFGERAQKLLSTIFDPLEDQLLRLGIKAEDIDYVAFDHFHTQDLRRLLGTEDGAMSARFPNAQLLAPKIEWEDWDDLHPLQRAWFVRDGKMNVKTENIIFTDGDYMLGDGVMILRTPGHTSGNQTLFINTASGVWGISENGTCADNWSPLESRIKGLATFCKKQDRDLILNSNTPESSLAQYNSMILERTVVDRVHRAPAFVQMFSSSEVTPSFLAPGLSPTLLHREINHGEVVRPPTRASSSSSSSSAAKKTSTLHVTATAE
jgi:glyoxylase-like metal-dependent hydrolase (beta-lactamase superfamily II)